MNTQNFSYITKNKFEGLEKNSIVGEFYIEDFVRDQTGFVWVKAIPMNLWRLDWDAGTYESLLRVYIIPSQLEGHWRYNQ